MPGHFHLIITRVLFNHCRSSELIVSCRNIDEMIVLILLVILIACVVQHNHASHLTWTNITVDFGVRTIINVTAGSSESGRLLGILGPSGCGKTTLLRVLSSRMQATHGVVIYSGEISDFEKEDTTLQKHEVAFVHQDDTFFPMLTVEETMRLAAQLRRISDSRSFPTDSRIPESTPSADDGVIRIMRSLGLIHVASSFVGSKSSGGRNADANSRRGISGGERKRLAVGSQMTGSPKLLIADEPTSGLDSFNSQRRKFI